MRVDIDVSRTASGWTLGYRVSGLQLASRTLAAVQQQGRELPAPSSGVVPDLDKLAKTPPDPNIVQQVGRYLFEALLGADHWSSIITHAGLANIEVVLLVDSADSFAQLPWEAMRTDVGPLLSDPKRIIAFARAVSSIDVSHPANLRLTAPLSVLFVVGAPLDDGRVRPAAEYLCVVERLRGAGIAPRVHLVLNANPESMREAMERHRPEVVHIAAHGAVESGRPYLEVQPNPGDAGEHTKLFAGQLDTLLRWNKQDGGVGRPAVVVLSACHTASSGGRLQIEAPLAAHLVSRGVPIAVGMGGRVADQACRLFARRFYEQLSKGGPVALAAAEGRLAALRAGLDPDRSLEWARPSLFFAQGLETSSIEVDQGWATARSASTHYRKYKDPPEYVGRIALRERVSKFLVTEPPQHGVLALVVEPPRSGRFGLTRTLERIALDAIDAGWIPVALLLTSGPDQTPRPTNWDALGKMIWSGIRSARDHFGLTRWDPHWTGLQRAQKHQDPGAAAAIVQQLDDDGLELDGPEALRMALEADLRALQQASGRRPVLLLDDVHQYGEIVHALLRVVLSANGIGTLMNGRKIPVILTGARTQTTEYQSGCNALKQATEECAHIETIDHAELPDGEWPIAYRGRLLDWTPPKVPTSPRALENLHSIVLGIPSNLHFSNLGPLLRFDGGHQFGDANDDELIRAVQEADHG